MGVMVNGMDVLDRKLVSILQSNGRASNAHIARSVRVSEGTVRRRLRRLIDSGSVRVVGVPDLERIGLGTVALIGLQVDLDQIDKVSDELTHLNETTYVAVTTGTFDVFLWVAVASAEDLGVFLREKVGAISGVRRAETFVNLAIKKRTYGPVL